MASKINSALELPDHAVGVKASLSRLRFIHDRRFFANSSHCSGSAFIMTASSWLVVTVTQIGHVH
jgi:hypothetical protein